MDLEDKVEKLKKETIALRKEMVIMRTLLKEQNEVIQNLLMKAQGDEPRNFTKTKDWFPITSQEQLDEFEKSVDNTTQDEIIREAHYLIRREGLAKNLHRIIHEQLVIEYNLEGNYNKRRLFNYPNLLDVLFKAAATEDWDHSKFIAEMRLGMKKIKKKTLKLNRQKSISAANHSRTFKTDEDAEETTSDDDDDENSE